MGCNLASAAIDPIWWLFVFWIPIYLNEVFAMDVKSMALYGWVPYAGAMIGAYYGGILARNKLKKGWSVDKTRKMVITLGCGIMLPALLAMANPLGIEKAVISFLNGVGAIDMTITDMQNPGATTAVILMAIILFGFQSAIGNVQTLPSDLFSGKTVGSLAGFSGMAAKLTAAGLTYLVPWLTSGGNYTPAFIIGATLSLLTVASVWIFIPKVKPVTKKV